MEARRYLQDIGSQVSADFVKNRSILSFEEYVTLFFNDPRGQVRNAAQYLHDVMDHYGTEQVSHATGTIRRFKLFDVPSSDRDGRVAGQEGQVATEALGSLARHYQTHRDAEGQYRVFRQLHLLRPQDRAVGNNFAFFAALTERGLVYLDPQNGEEVNLTNSERASIYMAVL